MNTDHSYSVDPKEDIPSTTELPLSDAEIKDRLSEDRYEDTQEGMSNYGIEYDPQLDDWV